MPILKSILTTNRFASPVRRLAYALVLSPIELSYLAKRAAHLLPLTVLAIMCYAPSVSAHEPIFGVGPHTVFKGGVAAEIEGEIDDNEFSNTFELAYGITPDLTITTQLPLVYQFAEKARPAHLGDAALRLKWRFLRLDSLGASDGFAVVGGVKFPTGASSGSIDLISALTYGHEGRRWYCWADIRYLLTTESAGVNRGDLFFYDAAFGARPWRMTYKEPDLVVLVEVNGRHIGTTNANGVTLPNTGGDIVTMGPALLLSIRNYMIKAGIAVPVWWSTNGSQAAPSMTGVVAFEGHF